MKALDRSLASRNYQKTASLLNLPHTCLDEFFSISMHTVYSTASRGPLVAVCVLFYLNLKLNKHLFGFVFLWELEVGMGFQLLFSLPSCRILPSG